MLASRIASKGIYLLIERRKMKKITYQIILDDDAYVECLDKLGKLMLFPANGNTTFKVEEIGGEDSRAIYVNGVMYDSIEDYRKVQRIREENKNGRERNNR